MREPRYSLPVPTSALRSTTSTDHPDWIDSHEIDDKDNVNPQDNSYINSFDNILAKANEIGHNLKYSDATMKTFVLVCEKDLNGKWGVKIERVNASCAFDLDEYRHIKGRR